MTAADPPPPALAARTPAAPAAPAVLAGPLGVVGRALLDVVRLVVPVACPGCGAWDTRLCGSCAAALGTPAWRCEGSVPRLDRPGGPAWPVWAAAAYAGPVRGVVVGWKDRGRVDLTPVLARAAGRAAAAAAADLAAVGDRGPLVVAGVPTTPAARRRRGEDLVAVLARAAAAELAARGVAVRAAPVLRRGHGVRDQVGLGARDRGRNAAASVRPRPGAGLRPGARVLLVDDVVTTGSTLVACERALAAAGVHVVGAVVVAATPPPAGRATRDLGPLFPRPVED